MNENEVLIDLLEDNRRRLRRVFEAMSDACLQWHPDPWANNILLTVWHMARMFDVFLTRQALGEPSDAETWFHEGWAERTGYDPRGVGQNGWGMLTGYSLDEAAQVPRMDREDTLAYLDQVYDRVRGYLEGITMDELQQPGAGFDGRYSRYQCLQMPLMDNVRHLGEIFAIKTRWEHAQGEGRTSGW
jgi:hypothetical protein